MSQSLQSISDALLTAAKKAGADNADAISVAGTSVSIDVRDGNLEQAERAEGTDVGLRVFVGQRQAIVSSSDTKPDTISQMAERAVAMAKLAPEDPYIGLADPEQLAKDWDVEALELSDPTEEPEPKQLQETAIEAENAAREIKGVEQVQSASAAYGATEIHIAATNGFSAGYRRTDNALSCVAIAGTGTGMERDYDGDFRVYRSDMRSAAEIGKLAGERCVERLGATRPKTGTYPVLFDERISSGLIGHLLAAINGTNIARGSSWLKDAMGKQVLPSGLTVTENPLRPRVTGSRPFDAEGLPRKIRNIVEDGVLQSWTLDLATARMLGLEPTGSAGRGTSGPPSPSVSNIELTAGTHSRDDLIRDMGTGLWVTSMIGSTINPNTGDYSRGAAGFWVENGEVIGPVNECTIAGNLREMLGRIVPANDARAHLSRVVPSILIDGMALAGE